MSWTSPTLFGPSLRWFQYPSVSRTSAISWLAVLSWTGREYIPDIVAVLFMEVVVVFEARGFFIGRSSVNWLPASFSPVRRCQPRAGHVLQEVF